MRGSPSPGATASIGRLGCLLGGGSPELGQLGMEAGHGAGVGGQIEDLVGVAQHLFGSGGLTLAVQDDGEVAQAVADEHGMLGCASGVERGLQMLPGLRQLSAEVGDAPEQLIDEHLVGGQAVAADGDLGLCGMDPRGGQIVLQQVDGGQVGIGVPEQPLRLGPVLEQMEPELEVVPGGDGIVRADSGAGRRRGTGRP